MTYVEKAVKLPLKSARFNSKRAIFLRNLAMLAAVTIVGSVIIATVSIGFPRDVGTQFILLGASGMLFYVIMTIDNWAHNRHETLLELMSDRHAFQRASAYVVERQGVTQANRIPQWDSTDELIDSVKTYMHYASLSEPAKRIADDIFGTAKTMSIVSAKSLIKDAADMYVKSAI